MKRKLFLFLITSLTTCWVDITNSFIQDNSVLTIPLGYSSADHSKAGDRIICYDFIRKTAERALTRNKNIVLDVVLFKRTMYSHNLPSTRHLEKNEPNQVEIAMYGLACLCYWIRGKEDFQIKSNELSRRSYSEKYGFFRTNSEEENLFFTILNSNFSL